MNEILTIKQALRLCGLPEESDLKGLYKLVLEKKITYPFPIRLLNYVKAKMEKKRYTAFGDGHETVFVKYDFMRDYMYYPLIHQKDCYIAIQRKKMKNAFPAITHFVFGRSRRN